MIFKAGFNFKKATTPASRPPVPSPSQPASTWWCSAQNFFNSLSRRPWWMQLDEWTDFPFWRIKCCKFLSSVSIWLEADIGYLKQLGFGVFELISWYGAISLECKLNMVFYSNLPNFWPTYLMIFQSGACQQSRLPARSTLTKNEEKPCSAACL